MTQQQLDQLIQMAQEVQKRAYAPYSHFQVGAALLGGSGKAYWGCNVENVSYPISLCAERSALAAAVAAGEDRIEAVVIVGGDEPCPPCGMCRQALAEFGPDMTVILLDAQGNPQKHCLRDLLPKMFAKDHLKNV